MKLPPGHVAGQGVAKPTCAGGFGERMLRTMGWDTGQGLGKEGTGIKEAIQVKKKEDTVGVGGNGSWAWGERWWEKAYDSAVQTVGGSSDTSDSSDSDSDDEHYAAIAAAVNRDGTRTSASADELKLLASLTKQQGRVAAGRFGGRDAKMARIRQQEAAMAAEAAAKLGVPSAAPSGPSGAAATTGTTATGGAGAGASDRSETTSEAKVGGSSKRGKKDKKKKQKEKGGGEGAASEASSGGKKRGAARGAAGGADQQPQQQEAGGQPPKRQRIVIEPKVAQVGPVYQFVPTPATGWWGEKVFTSAGCMAGVDKEAAEAARRRVTFDEDDQARIYMAAQAKKTQGKVGLGQGTGTVKVGGVKWEGRKVTFEEPAAAEGGGEGGDDAEEAAAAAAIGGARLAAIGSCTHLDELASGGGGRGDSDAAPSGGGGEGGEGWAARVKWRKIIGGQLAAAEGGRLTVKELQRAVVAAVLAKHASLAPSKAAVQAAFAERLQASSRFVVEGKLVRLRG